MIMHHAKRTLEKYGWREGEKQIVYAWILIGHPPYVSSVRITGKGLGKDETGVVHSIKVPLKKDTSGVCVFIVFAC